MSETATRTGLADESYVCGVCGDTFLRARSDEEAMGEALGVFEAMPDPVVICDDCWLEFVPWMRENHPEAMR